MLLSTHNFKFTATWLYIHRYYLPCIHVHTCVCMPLFAWWLRKCILVTMNHIKKLFTCFLSLHCILFILHISGIQCSKFYYLKCLLWILGVNYVQLPFSRKSTTVNKNGIKNVLMTGFFLPCQRPHKTKFLLENLEKEKLMLFLACYTFLW